MKILLTPISVCLLVMVGCAPQPTQTGPSAFSSDSQRTRASGADAEPASSRNGSRVSVKIDDDQFRPVIEYTVNPSLNIGEATVAFGGAKARNTGTKTYASVIGVVYTASSWAFFSSARDEQANSLTFTRLKRDVNCTGSRYSGCTYSEIFAVSLNELKLRQALATDVPYRFKVFGESRPFEVAIPPHYISALFNEMGVSTAASQSPPPRTQAATK